MYEDNGWEDAAFNTRHLHNHNARGRGRAGNVRHEFEVRNTMGTHLIKCTALDRLQAQHATGPAPSSSPAETGSRKTAKSGGGGGGGSGAAPKKKVGGKNNAQSGSGVVLEIYRLTDGEDGLLGSLRCGNVFEATAVFAGSRKTLSKITRQLEGAGSDVVGSAGGSGGRPSARERRAAKKGLAVNGERRGSKADSGVGKGSSSEDASSSSGEDDEVDSDDDGDDAAAFDTTGEGRRRQRIATFEKNSFRQPKFWFRWQGVTATDAKKPVDREESLAGDDDEDRDKVHGSGYLVFSGNDCRRFQGTMTSEQMGWNNVKMTGFKTRPQPERDFEIFWSPES